MQAAEDQWVQRWGFHTRGLATDNLSRGLRLLPMDEALTRTYLATNNTKATNLLVLDVDDPEAERLVKSLSWDTEVLPEPNALVLNPATGHGHAHYWLTDSVVTTELARVKPMRYAAAVHEGLRQIVPGDPGYTNRITRNPLTHPTVYMREESYGLRELAARIHIPKALPRRARATGLGRNCTLFDDLRTWAYSGVRGFDTHADFDRATHLMAQTLAIQFITDPLPASEVASVARSVSRWVWARFDTSTFRTIQKHRSRKRVAGLTITKGNDMDRSEYRSRAEERRMGVVRRYDEGKTYAEIAAEMDMTYNQVRSAIQYQRRLTREEGRSQGKK